MKISEVESLKALSRAEASGSQDAKILPADRPRGLVSSKAKRSGFVTPLERGMAVAEAALSEVADVRADLVEDLKAKVKSGEYEIRGDEVAGMMLRRLAADRVR